MNWNRVPGNPVVKNPPSVQEMWVLCLGREDLLEKGMATHSSILVWEIPWTERPGGLQSMGSQILNLGTKPPPMSWNNSSLTPSRPGKWCYCQCVFVAQLCWTFCAPMGCNPLGSSVHRILQARIWEWLAIPFSRGSSQHRDWIWSPALQADSLQSEPLSVSDH